METKAKILKYRKVKAKGKEAYQIVLDKTPFYAESGGQVGDTGELIINNEELRIIDTKKENDLIIHFTENIPGKLSGEVTAKLMLQKENIPLFITAPHISSCSFTQSIRDTCCAKRSLGKC